MIIVRLSGGLGNQMFQYAFGRNLALLRGDELLLDIKNFGKIESETKREYKLSVFNINEEIASNDEIKKVIVASFLDIVYRKLFKYDSSHLLERGGYDARYKKMHGDVYLDGYWQSGKYFAEYKDIIRNDFILKKKLSVEAEYILKQINNAKISISLHVRAGDYFTDKRYLKMFGQYSICYYQKVIDFVMNNYGQCTFFVFSVDIDWVKNNLKLPSNTIYINGNDFEDMYLMSQCNDNIIANSSFSWWGAWLNKKSSKKVFYPMKWSDNCNVDDLIPKEWVGI